MRARRARSMSMSIGCAARSRRIRASRRSSIRSAASATSSGGRPEDRCRSRPNVDTALMTRSHVDPRSAAMPIRHRQPGTTDPMTSHPVAVPRPGGAERRHATHESRGPPPPGYSDRSRSGAGARPGAGAGCPPPHPLLRDPRGATGSLGAAGVRGARSNSSAVTSRRSARDRRSRRRSVARRSTSARPQPIATTRARSASRMRSAGWSSATAPPGRPGRRCRLTAGPTRRDRSGRLVEHPLDGLRGVLGRVDRVLELAIEVAPLDDLERLGPVAEQPCDGRP